MTSNARRYRVLAGCAVAVLAGVAPVALAGRAEAAAGCRVEYRATSWPGGFTAAVDITNLGDTLTGWRLEWNFADPGQHVGAARNAVATQTGRHVTLANAAWNATLRGNATVHAGVQGTWTTANPAPTGFTLNAVPCTGTVVPSASPSTSDSGRESHVDNPYPGRAGYVDPQWRALADSVPGGSRVSGTPTGVWLNRVSQIAGTTGEMGLRAHLDAALAQGAGYVQVVLNDLPERDCTRLLNSGDFAAGEVARYESQYVDPIVAIESDPKYGRLRIIDVVEPDAVPDLLVTSNPPPRCVEEAQYGDYQTGIRYALDRLRPYSNVYLYLGVGNHGELGWDAMAAPAADLIAAIARGTAAGLSGIDGVIANTAGYAALVEPYFTIDTLVNGASVRLSRWVDWNNFVDELPFAQRMRDRLVALGFPAGIGALVDTSRDGWGGPNRPTRVSTSTDVNTFVDQSRIDRRIYYGNWCNQSGAGLGARPAAAPQPGIDAYVWMMPPGISDGAADPARAADPSSGYDYKCDPDYLPVMDSPWPPTGALRGAPALGAWFPAQFSELMANAYPPLP